MAEDDINLDDYLDALTSGIQKPKSEKKSDRFYDDMEWFLLVAIMRCPKIISEIVEIIPDPKMFTGFSGGTSHALIFQALTNLWDEGIDPFFERLYAECEKIRGLEPLTRAYSRATIMELDFQAATSGQKDQDSNRIRGKFCAEQVVRRK